MGCVKIHGQEMLLVEGACRQKADVKLRQRCAPAQHLSSCHGAGAKPVVWNKAVVPKNKM